MLQKIGFFLLGIAVLMYMVAIFGALVMSMPIGLIGILAIGGSVLLFIQVVIERMNNEEDDYYSKNVHQ